MLPFLWKLRPCGAPCQAIAVGAQSRYSCNPAKEPNIANGPAIGTVVAIWRYPVKSMQGEELSTTPVDERGLLGDRGYALVHSEDGKIASAKNPRKWPHLFEFRTGYVGAPVSGRPLPPVRITLPDGSVHTSDAAGTDAALSTAVGRAVSLRAAVPETPVLEEYWPDIDGLAHRETVTDEKMPENTFFDVGIVHLLTTAALHMLAGSYPQGKFEVRRFRPNIVVAPAAGTRGFVENDWVERTLRLGDEVRLQITMPCGRCVMTTLPQGDLPRDTGILRTAVQQNQGNVGVYAHVVRGGMVRHGDTVTFDG
jgi:uncharacterized protein YcbX